MPIVYENEGHMRRMQRMYPQFAFKMTEWRKDKTCRLCKRHMHIHAIAGKWKSQATCDHVLAQSLGGADEESNWMLVCGKCNNDKSKLENKTLLEKKALTFEEQ